MKKIYLSAAALLLGGIAMGQSSNGNSQQSINTEHSVQQTARSGNYSPDAAPEFGSRATHFSEDFESGTFPPTGWTVASGANSTTTDPTQDWHEEATGNPGSCASVLYVNSVDQHDEWLISPAIVLPSGALRLEFDINTSQFWHVDPNDNGDIVCYISTVGNTINDLAAGDSIFWEQDQSIVNDWQTYVWYAYQTDLTAYAGQTIYLGWHYEGLDAAQFNLDNISIYDIDDNDLTPTVLYGADVNQDYEYSIYDRTQLRPLGMSAIIKNNGSVTQTNIGINYEILDGSGTVVDQGSSTAQLPGLAAGEEDTVFHVSGFTPPTNVEDYTVNVWPYADAADMNMNNDTISKPISVGLEIFAREQGPITSGITNISTGTGQSFKIGNTYIIQGDVDVNGLEIGIGANSPVGQIVFGEIYYWDGADYIWLATTEEKTIAAADLSTIIHFDWESGNPVEIPDGTDVLAVAGHYGGNVDGSDDVEIATSGNTIQGTVLGFDNGGSLFQLIDPSVPVVRLNIGGFTGLEDLTSESGIVLAQNQPNPFNDLTTVNYTLPSQGNVSVEVYDMMGKTIMTLNEGQRAAGDHQVVISGTDLAAGAYHFTLVVNGERLTRQMIVTR